MDDVPLVVQVRHEPGGYAVITVAGEIDIATVPQLRQCLAAPAASGPLITDLDQVTFIDAAGLGALAGAARQAAWHGASLHVVCARSETRQLIRLTSLDRQLRLTQTLAEALQALQAGPDAPGSMPQRPSPAGQPASTP